MNTVSAGEGEDQCNNRVLIFTIPPSFANHSQAIQSQLSTYGKVSNFILAQDRCKPSVLVSYNTVPECTAAQAGLAAGLQANDEEVKVEAQMVADTSRKVYVRNMPSGTPQQEITSYFLQFGQVFCVDVRPDGNSTTCIAAYVHFKDKMAAAFSILAASGQSPFQEYGRSKGLSVREAESLSKRNERLKSKPQQPTQSVLPMPMPTGGMLPAAPQHMAQGMMSQSPPMPMQMPGMLHASSPHMQQGMLAASPAQMHPMHFQIGQGTPTQPQNMFPVMMANPLGPSMLGASATTQQSMGTSLGAPSVGASLGGNGQGLATSPEMPQSAMLSAPQQPVLGMSPGNPQAMFFVPMVGTPMPLNVLGGSVSAPAADALGIGTPPTAIASTLLHEGNEMST